MMKLLLSLFGLKKGLTANLPPTPTGCDVSPEAFVAVEGAVDVIRRGASLDDKELVGQLVSAGQSEAEAELMVEFIVLAYGRAWLAPHGAHFDDSYSRIIQGKKFGDYVPLDSEPIFRIAYTLATAEMKDGRQEEVLMIASRSSLYNTANNALSQGASIKGASFSPTLFLRPLP
jgi:hypothetical protein